MSKARYMRELYARLVCAHCGIRYDVRLSQKVPNVILHHPNNDGHLGRVGDIPASTPNLIARIDAEVGRCVPLCRSCHGKEHERQFAAVGRGASLRMKAFYAALKSDPA
jgi:hypothetical protein